MIQLTILNTADTLGLYGKNGKKTVMLQLAILNIADNQALCAKWQEYGNVTINHTEHR